MKKTFTLEEERIIYEKQWDEVYNECLKGNINQLKLFSVMTSMQRVQHQTFKNKYEKRIQEGIREFYLHSKGKK